MIHEERDAGFWRQVAEHPEVEPYVLMGLSADVVDRLVARADVTPLASESGGFLFLEGEPGEFELHTLFRPEGWGREVASAAREAFALMFNQGARVISTQEQEGRWRSRPPKSHGWKEAGDFYDAGLPVRLRPWTLTRDDWASSPVGRRICR